MSETDVFVTSLFVRYIFVYLASISYLTGPKYMKKHTKRSTNNGYTHTSYIKKHMKMS